MDPDPEREVHELHRFFQEWFRGELEDGDSALGRLDAALAQGFTMVTPGGVRRPRAELLTGLRAARGSRSDERPPFRIWIEALEARPLGRDLLLCTYEEWQTVPGGRRGRLSSAVLAPDPGAPRGVLWLHLHETWLPGPAAG